MRNIKNRSSAFISVPILCTIILLFTFIFPIQLMAYKVNFVVSLPASTPDTADIYIAGNFNAWNPAATKLNRHNNSARITLDLSGKIEYKFTRGNWATVEKNKNGSEMQNRQSIISSDTTIRCFIQAWADQFQRGTVMVQHTLTGNIEYIHNFYSPQLNNKRTLIIYLPPDYYKDTDARYPVLYMHDGQNIFDKATSFIGEEWQADETTEFLIKKKKIRPIIIVGIYNNVARNDEYTPWPDYSLKQGGKGDLYAKFIIETIKPYIDKHYRTLPDKSHTAIIGSSLGGLISTYIAFKYPQYFGMVGAMSPAYWWADNKIMDFLKKVPKNIGPEKFYIDIGTAESSSNQSESEVYLGQARRMVKALETRGYRQGINLMYYEDHGAPHNEKAWAKRFYKPLIFFFGVNRYAEK